MRLFLMFVIAVYVLILSPPKQVLTHTLHPSLDKSWEGKWFYQTLTLLQAVTLKIDIFLPGASG